MMANRLPNEKRLSYEQARKKIGDGDLLLFRRKGLISVAGRGVHSHAAMAAWWGDDLFCLEMRGKTGGRAVTLSSQVKRFSGLIDWFEVNPDRRWPDFDRAGAVREMRRLAGCDYGWANIFKAALLHLPVLRFFCTVKTDDQTPNRLPPFCSQAVALADRIGGGVDPVCHLADQLTEPADLARSPLYQYRNTLVSVSE